MKHACCSGSLFQILNKTRTMCGARLLKASLLQPLTDVHTIIARLDAVEELCGCVEDTYEAAEGQAENQSNTMSFGVAVWLRDSLPRDMDHTCRSLGLVSTGTDKAASRSTSSRSQQLTKLVLAIISLKKLLASLPALAEILQPARTVLLAAIRSNIQSPMFDEMLSEIQEIIDEDAHAVKNQFMNHIQCCFAVKVAPLL